MLSRFTALLALSCSSAALAEIKVEHIKYTCGQTTLEGVLVYDAAATDKRPGVLVCPEWWGRNDYADNRAKQLAALGYVAFAIDMYGEGKTTTDPKQAGEWSGQVMRDPKEMRSRAGAGLKVLAESARVDSTKLAAVGYCMGGTVALELARSAQPHTESLLAIVPFHASTIAAANAEDNKNIKGTVLVCHGQDDAFVRPEQIESFHKQMKDAGIDYAFVSFAGAVHAFTNPGADAFGVPGVKYNQKADRRSWSAMKDLFAEVFSSKRAATAKPESKPASSGVAEKSKPAKN
jgi:dienelactone hydrolase